MSKIRVSAVSYTNTKPFVYGIQHDQALLEKMDFMLDIPADCARKLKEGRADLGLVPVAVLPALPYYEIVSDYCIGAVDRTRHVQEKHLSVRLDLSGRLHI